MAGNLICDETGTGRWTVTIEQKKEDFRSPTAMRDEMWEARLDRMVSPAASRRKGNSREAWKSSHWQKRGVISTNIKRENAGWRENEEQPTTTKEGSARPGFYGRRMAMLRLHTPSSRCSKHRCTAVL